MSDNIKDATFVYTSDYGAKILAPCKFNTATKEVFDIETKRTRSVNELYNANDYVVCDGITYKAYSIEVLMGDSISDNTCWYK